MKRSVNPYAIKKKAKPTVADTPLFLLKADKNNENDENDNNSNSNSSSGHCKQGSTCSALSPSAATFPSSTNQQQQQKQQEQNEQSSSQKTRDTETDTTTSSEVSPQDRLPSRIVTFGPAEILTVTELHTHLAYYSSSSSEEKKKRSVRVTGVVRHRCAYLAGNGVEARVCFLLGDPLTPPPTSLSSSWLSSPPPQQQQRPQKQTSTTVTPSSPTPAATTKPLSILGNKRPLSSTAKASTPLLSNHKTPRTIKKRFVHVPKSATPIGRRLSGGLMGSSAKLARKRPLSSSSSLMQHHHPLDAVRRMLRNQPSLVVVLVAATQLENNNNNKDEAIRVGDFVTALGEVVAVTTRAATINTAQQQQDDEDEDDEPQLLTARGIRYYLQPRIVRKEENDGMDVQLQHKALLLRRRYLLQKHQHKPGIVGCGPPAPSTPKETTSKAGVATTTTPK